jgi:hypothetical protein
MAHEFKHKDPCTIITQAEYIGACGDGHVFACQATGDILIADSTTVLKRLGKGGTSDVLQIVSCRPSWTSTPTIGSTSWANAGHAHAASNSGGTLNASAIGAGTLGVARGGTGATCLTNGGVLLGSGTGAITAMGVLSDGQMIVGDGSTDPVAESGATLRTSIGVGTGDSPQFTGLTLTGALTAGAASTISIDADSEFVGLKLTNQSDSADTNGFVSLAFDLEDTGGNAVDSGKISVKKEASFTDTASTQDSSMEFYTSLNGTLAEKMTLNSAGCLTLDGNIVISTSGKGIDFAAKTPDATCITPSSEVLDDYEEGAWTPVIKSADCSVYTLTTEVGYYTKIGRVVYFNFRVDIGSTPSSKGCQAIRLFGLPFAAPSGSAYYGNGLVANQAIDTDIVSGASITGSVEPSTSYAGLFAWDGVATSALTGTELNNGTLDGSGTYITAT